MYHCNLSRGMESISIVVTQPISSLNLLVFNTSYMYICCPILHKFVNVHVLGYGHAKFQLHFIIVLNKCGLRQGQSCNSLASDIIAYEDKNCIHP